MLEFELIQHEIIEDLIPDHSRLFQPVQCLVEPASSCPLLRNASGWLMHITSSIVPLKKAPPSIYRSDNEYSAAGAKMILPDS